MKTQEISAEKLLGIIEEKDRKIAELEQQINWFMSQIRLAKHKQFGVSSEQTDIMQMSIFNEAESNADKVCGYIIVTKSIIIKAFFFHILQFMFYGIE